VDVIQGWDQVGIVRLGHREYVDVLFIPNSLNLFCHSVNPRPPARLVNLLQEWVFRLNSPCRPLLYVSLHNVQFR
jgi:hypothetical protein